MSWTNIVVLWSFLFTWTFGVAFFLFLHHPYKFKMKLKVASSWYIALILSIYNIVVVYFSSESIDSNKVKFICWLCWRAKV